MHIIFLCIHKHTRTHTHTHTAVPCEDNTLRVQDGFNPRTGRLEICVERVWSTICGTDFTDEMAAAACVAMGTNTAQAGGDLETSSVERHTNEYFRQ